MIFNELYGCYYNAVAKILEKAIEAPINKNQMREIIEKHAFNESFFEISSKLQAQEYRLLNKDGTTPIKNKPTMPLTTLQKRWLKAIFLDKRIRLFTDTADILPDIEPIFSPNDYYLYDSYSDGDNYGSESYIKNFRTVLTAIKENKNLKIAMVSNKGRNINTIAKPDYIEYSPKDDKFRLYTKYSFQVHIVNIANITSCEIYHKEIINSRFVSHDIPRRIEIELYDERNALERFMLHFAHFRKMARKESNKIYHITVYYEAIDETELIIRILSFGQFVKVLSPDSFVRQIRYRLNKQNLLFQNKNADN